MGLGGTAMAITPNKLLSRGLTAYTSSGENHYITDGDLTNWKQCTAKEIALNVGEGPSRLFISWESYGDCAWATDFTSGCGHTGISLRNFKILTSSNSTNGQDGDWILATEVKDNPVMARGIYIDFDGMSWFRFVSEENVGQILEIEAFDASNDGDDTWFFMGTSISQMGLKQQDTDSTTANIIHGRFPNFTPAMLRGGIGCINSTEVVAHLDDYLRYAGNVKHWAIEMGTNDAWGGGDWNLETYKRNMQTIIDSAKAHGIEPILARIIATNESKAGWQVNPKFLQAIDELTQENNLHPGPDFYSYFLAHPEQIASDGVHPNGETKGGQAMHHLWADALSPLYANSEIEKPDTTSIQEVIGSSVPSLHVNGNNIRISGIDADITVDVISASGKVEEQHSLCGQQEYEFTSQVTPGLYIIVVKWNEGYASYKVTLF
ncbi:MAG: SGNH/GDSL hydrolase family protein [Paludibacteraceae bacterium]|jgi:lysophospholipase L1-like esterase|nr:SGNH/GDSL hydrolase family protein [Paludibacteraceae bacterium]